MPVPNPFCIKPNVFDHFFKHGDFPKNFEPELKEIYNKITSKGYDATVRTPDVISQSHPHLSHATGNSLFIKSFTKFFEAIKDKYTVIQNHLLREDINDAEVSTLLHSTYDSHLCGLVQTDDGYGQIRIEAGFGQNSNILSRNDVNPDIYIVDKQTLNTEKQINKKSFEFIAKSGGGIEKVPLPSDKQNAQVFSDQIIKTYAEYALKLEKEYGPQEFECAVTTKEDLLIQETRPMKVIKKAKTIKGVTAIVPGEVKGTVLNANTLAELPPDCSQTIIVADTMEIDFITMLVFKYRPKAVILKKGTLTAHTSTILREAGMISYIIKNINLKNNDCITIHKNGSTTFA